MKHYSTKELLEINNKAPLQVQETLSSETTISTISNLGASFELHIDKIGLIAELNVQMLLGLVSPEEFLKELIVAKISEKDAREILAEINQKIFVPLREEMRKGPVPAPEAAKPATLQGAAATPPRPLLAGVKPPQVLIPAPPSQKPALRDVLASVMKPSPAPAAPIVPALAPTPATSSAPPQRAAPPENLPGVPLPPQTVPAAPAPESRTEPPKQSAPVAPAKPYSVDPYREPVDEK